MAARFLITGGGSVTWDASNTAIWSATSGGATGASVPVDGDTVTMDASSGGGTVTLGYNPTVTSITMGAFTGTFNASTFSPTMDTFNGSGTGTRTLNMGSGTWTLRGSSTTIWTTATTTNLTLDVGTSTVNCTYSGSAGTRTITTGATAALGLNTLNITAGTDTVAFTTQVFCQNISFAGFSGTWNNTPLTSSGSVTFGTGMTVTDGGSTITLTATSGTNLITSNGVAVNRNITLNGVGGTWQLADALSISTVTSTRTLTLTNGTFDANNFNVTCGSFSSSNSNTRTLTMGSGTWTLTGNNATIWNLATMTNMTITGSGSIVCNYSGSTGTRTFNHGATAGASVMPVDVYITAGTDTVTFVGSSSDAGAFKSIDFTGFSGTQGTATGSGLYLTGSLTMSSTMTQTAASTRTYFFQGTGTLTTNGVTFGYNLRTNSASSLLTLGSSLTMDTGCLLTVTLGTFNANNYNITTPNVSSSGSGVRTITMGSGTWTLTGTGTVWDLATATNLTFDAGTSTIKVTDASASSKTFKSGTLTYYNLWLTGGGAGAMILGSSTATNTFNSIRVDPLLTVQVFAGSTLALSAPYLILSGTPAQTNIFESTTAGVAWNITCASGTFNEDYISLKDSAASGGALFYAGSHSVNVSGNSGWLFSDAPSSTQNAAIDDNFGRTMIAVSAQDLETPVRVATDANTGALLITVT